MLLLSDLQTHTNFAVPTHCRQPLGVEFLGFGVLLSSFSNRLLFKNIFLEIQNGE
jgi:hypothetical protein